MEKVKSIADGIISFGNCVRSTTNLSLGKEEWIVWIFGR